MVVLHVFTPHFQKTKEEIFLQELMCFAAKAAAEYSEVKQNVF